MYSWDQVIYLNSIQQYTKPIQMILIKTIK